MGGKIRQCGVDRSFGNLQMPARRTLNWATSLLLELGGDLRRARAVEATLQSVTRAAAWITRSVQSTVRLLDDGGKRLLCGARTGPSVHRRGSPPFKLGEGFIGWVAVHRRPAFTNRVANDPRFVPRAGQVWTPSAVMAVPLLSHRSCIGVLSVSRKDGTPYRPLDLELLDLIGQLSVPHLEIARLKRLNESDPLTLLHNRRHLQQRLPAEIQRSRRSGRPLAAAMIDIDHFKKINDSRGHEVGDEALAEIADRLRRVSRGSDVVFRWGGEEFFIIFPETSLQQGRKIAERIRQSATRPLLASSEAPLGLTVSVGLAALERDDDAHSLAQRADQALYAAKRQGRNRVVSLKKTRRNK